MDMGRLRLVQLREVFNHEAHDFTPWLAREENLEELGKALHLDLELEGTEVDVGPYKADLVARDGDDKVVVENQLTSTNHDHLGKTLTYAAGLQAKTIVWIAESFTEEHRQALDYLNEVTTEDLRLFGIEMRLFRIGDSAPAPQFQIVSRPNDFVRAVSASRSSRRAMTETKQLYLEFWKGWKDYVSARRTSIRAHTPHPRYWSNLSIGRSGFHLALTASAQRRFIRCELYLKSAAANEAFSQLEAQKAQIEEITGPLVRMALPGKQACRIGERKHDVDVTDETTWPEAYAWLFDRAQTYNKAFRSRLKKMQLATASTSGSDAEEDDEETDE